MQSWYAKYLYILLLNLSLRSSELLPVQDLPLPHNPVRIGLFYKQNFKELDISVSGICKVRGDGIILPTTENSQIKVFADGNFTRLCLDGIDLFYYRQIVIEPMHKATVDISHRGKKYNYHGYFEIQSQNDELKVVNILNMADYLEGVLCIEAGTRQHPEFYKAQAVISRTYFYRNVGRHFVDGFNLCDGQHCQAYKGVCEVAKLKQSIIETEGLVLIDKDSSLIISAYHSNCGGSTMNSGDLWPRQMAYLVAVSDEYCVNENRTYWEAYFEKEDFYKYFKRMVAPEDTVFVKELLFENTESEKYFFDQKERKSSLKIGSTEIPIQRLRNEFRLKSTFFEIIVKENEVIFKGRGNGHGVGLCQQGGMVMAKQGKTYQDIIHKYYTNVKFININEFDKKNFMKLLIK